MLSAIYLWNPIKTSTAVQEIGRKNKTDRHQFKKCKYRLLSYAGSEKQFEMKKRHINFIYSCVDIGNDYKKGRNFAYFNNWQTCWGSE